ncbi:hypothetical protein OO013_18325 [Mangrovivirga sp. M17]|uniref:Uncharacterized protein n=1 Tax=Mangrovivirga halotolerans TaxID=2993936 RepID=A0ABT3RW49_9BACT|nr:hypothetical protein [Mangrovivirga halotolerans]MCX2745845.1 hypothetical protein [Mangrovivirga halotolerans]
MQIKDGFTTKRKIGGVIFHLYRDAADFYDNQIFNIGNKQNIGDADLAEELLLDINPSDPLISINKIRKALSLVKN